MFKFKNLHKIKIAPIKNILYLKFAQILNLLKTEKEKKSREGKAENRANQRKKKK
jgi:hypothetical protein